MPTSLTSRPPERIAHPSRLPLRPHAGLRTPTPPCAPGPAPRGLHPPAGGPGGRKRARRPNHLRPVATPAARGREVEPPLGSSQGTHRPGPQHAASLVSHRRDGGGKAGRGARGGGVPVHPQPLLPDHPSTPPPPRSLPKPGGSGPLPSSECARRALHREPGPALRGGRQCLPPRLPPSARSRGEHARPCSVVQSDTGSPPTRGFSEGLVEGAQYTRRMLSPVMV